MIKRCITTNKIVTNDFVEFHCPQCKERITRSLEARAKSLAYKCPGCGFTGP
ncbi:MAG: RNA-binding protein [Candidatus Diapherotrites archaeon]|uniref:RNA-binding protein n=1 Tax=Candidatus Iainarchaeum sp. TaxID=3101447 RepID=A0A8T3YQQ1_9ARCH|nr:RNA-binding protein [Candidatus Diapherotrites archaeon]